MAIFISIQIYEYTLYENSGDPERTPRSLASDLGLHCLPMSHRKDARLIWVKHLPKSQISTQKQCLFQHLEILVPIAQVLSEGSGETVHPPSLTSAFAARLI